MPDVIAALDAAGLDYRETRRGWVEVPCPRCGSADNGGINLTSGQFNCWECGPLPIRRILREWTGDDSLYARYWGRDAFTVRKIRERVTGAPREVRMPGGPLLPIHLDYLRSRGLDPDELVRLYKIEGTDHVGSWKFRVMIPIFHDGKLVSYQGRDITGRSSLRYKACAKGEGGMPIKSTLYGAWLVPGDVVVVAEGIVDAWKLGPGAVALYGLQYTPAQVRLLSRYRRAVIVFDDEPGARERAGMLEAELGVLGVAAEARVFRGVKDPGEVPLERARAFVAEILRE